MTSNDSSRVCSPLRARATKHPLKHPPRDTGSQPLALRTRLVDQHREFPYAKNRKSLPVAWESSNSAISTVEVARSSINKINIGSSSCLSDSVSRRVMLLSSIVAMTPQQVRLIDKHQGRRRSQHLPSPSRRTIARRRSPLRREGIQLDDDVFSKVIG
jgi:hypothetical protein